jgi:hypothetical protein
MPIRFKTGLDNLRALERATRRRVQDEEFIDISQEEIDTRVNKFLRLGMQLKAPHLHTALSLNSHHFREFLRDARFFIGANNGQLSDLETEIRNASKDAFGVLNDLQNEAQALNSTLTEEEIKLAGYFDVVHFNAFIRQIDTGLSFSNSAWLQDYKTELPFLADNIVNLIPNTGLTLPLRERVRVPIIDAVLVGEETDVGDSQKTIHTTDPRNVFLPTKVFRHIIIRREHDGTTRKYKRTPSSITFLLELPNLQLINHMIINPVGHSTLTIEDVSFINEAGEEVSLSTDQISTEINTTVLFEPIRTRFLKVRFTQFAPLTKSFHNVHDERISKINDILRGAGFSMLLEEAEEDIQGRVFDFSISNLSVGLFIYEPLGVFRSRPVKVNRPAGLTITNRAESIRVTSDQRGYGAEFELPEGVVLNEFYVGVNFRDINNNVVLRDLLPVPDSYPIQREFLPIIGDKSKLKLFPDIIWNLDKLRVLNAVVVTHLVPNIAIVVTDPFVAIEVSSVHSFEVGDLVTILAPQENGITDTYEVVSIEDDFNFTISIFTSEGVLGNFGGFPITPSTTPFVYVFKADTAISLQQDPPLNVYKENTLLQLGPDYEISLDGGETFSGEWPRGQELFDALEDARSGRCRVKFIDPDYEKFYWTEYRPLKNQWLGNTKLARLKNGRVVFDRSLRFARGTINTVVTMRADDNNPYVTPIISFYSLKVREFDGS